MELQSVGGENPSRKYRVNRTVGVECELTAVAFIVISYERNVKNSAFLDHVYPYCVKQNTLRQSTAILL